MVPIDDEPSWRSKEAMVLDALARNEVAHREITAGLGALRELVVELRTDIEHLSGRRLGGRGWWRPVVLSVGLGALVSLAGWGGYSIYTHGERIAAVEAKQKGVP